MLQATACTKTTAPPYVSIGFEKFPPPQAQCQTNKSTQIQGGHISIHSPVLEWLPTADKLSAANKLSAARPQLKYCLFPAWQCKL
jgi:hypothetical protein